MDATIRPPCHIWLNSSAQPKSTPPLDGGAPSVSANSSTLAQLSAMSFSQDVLKGIALSCFGSVLIGCGQTCQKYAINRLSSTYSSLPVATSPPGSLQPRSAPVTESMRARLRDPLWIAGIILSYSGEVFGNWFALGYVSAAIVTPMGVISVLTTAILGSIILGEEITLRQRRGYVLLIAAVFGVLIVAPKGGQVLGDTAADVISFCLSPIFLCGALVIVICQSGLIYLVFGRGRFGLAELVGVCSLFGAINVTCGRIISVLVRVSASSSGDTETEPVSEEPTVLSKTSLSLAVAAVAVMIVCSIVGQEYFKQEALSRYPVSTFQPVLFAGFNTAAVLTSIVLFREIPTLIEHLVFLSVFGLCMWTVFVGSRMIEQESPADVETQKET